jgi:hypothetical protein
MVSIKFILGAAVSATFASAHMELLWPPALRSKYNSLTPETSIGEYSSFTRLDLDQFLGAEDGRVLITRLLDELPLDRRWYLSLQG